MPTISTLLQRKTQENINNSQENMKMDIRSKKIDVGIILSGVQRNINFPFGTMALRK